MFLSFIYAAAALYSIAQVYEHDEVLTFSNNVQLVITAGSEASTITGTSTNATVTIPAGSEFSVRYVGPTAGLILNNVGDPSCRNVGGHNQVTFVGPKQVTIIPDPSVFCIHQGVQVAGSNAMFVSVQMPGGGEYHTGDAVPVQWSTTTSLGVHHIRVRLTMNGGQSYTTVSDNEENDGSLTFVAPSFSGTHDAVVRVEAMAFDGTVLAYADSGPSFVLIGPVAPAPAPTPTPEPTPAPTPQPTPSGSVSVSLGVSGEFVPATVLAGVVSIDNDKSLVAVSGATCVAGTLVRASMPAVYYCGADGKRYVFPNQKVYDTWYTDFSGVQRISDAQLAQIALGGNVTYRPGKRMVKIQSDPRVYVVAQGGVLRSIPSEAAAAALYGASWQTLVDDVPDAFFVNYTLGTSL